MARGRAERNAIWALLVTGDKIFAFVVLCVCSFWELMRERVNSPREARVHEVSQAPEEPKSSGGMERFPIDRARLDRIIEETAKKYRASGELLRANEKRWDDEKRADGIHAGIIKPDDESNPSDNVVDHQQAEQSSKTDDHESASLSEAAIGDPELDFDSQEVEQSNVVDGSEAASFSEGAEISGVDGREVASGSQDVDLLEADGGYAASTEGAASSVVDHLEAVSDLQEADLSGVTADNP